MVAPRSPVQVQRSTFSNIQMLPVTVVICNTARRAEIPISEEFPTSAEITRPGESNVVMTKGGPTRLAAIGIEPYAPEVEERRALVGNEVERPAVWRPPWLVCPRVLRERCASTPSAGLPRRAPRRSLRATGRPLPPRQSSANGNLARRFPARALGVDLRRELVRRGRQVSAQLATRPAWPRPMRMGDR